MHVGELQEEETRGKAQSHNYFTKLLPAQPRSQLNHVGVSFTRLRQINSKEIYRGLFLD